MTKSTVLKPAGDELNLYPSFILENPTVKFTVDGKEIETTDQYPKLNLLNNKKHIIGVNVSHQIETVENSDVKVKFEYEWIDV